MTVGAPPDLEAQLEVASSDEDPESLRREAAQARLVADRYQSIHDTLQDAHGLLVEAHETAKLTPSDKSKHILDLMADILSYINHEERYEVTTAELKQNARMLEADANKIEEYRRDNDE